MTKKQQAARLAFAKAIGQSEIYPIVDKLIKACITHHRYQECKCNGATRDKLPFETWKQYDQAREEQMRWLEHREELLERRIEKLAKALKLEGVQFDGDPRGFTVRFIVRDTPYAVGAGVWEWR